MPRVFLASRWSASSSCAQCHLSAIFDDYERLWLRRPRMCDCGHCCTASRASQAPGYQAMGFQLPGEAERLLACTGGFLTGLLAVFLLGDRGAFHSLSTLSKLVFSCISFALRYISYKTCCLLQCLSAALLSSGLFTVDCNLVYL